MTEKLTRSLANRKLMEFGYFDGLHRLIEEYKLPDDLVVKLKIQLYKHILVKVLEAKNEVAKLQAATMRLEAVCRAGTVAKPLSKSSPAYGENYQALTNALQPFDGWVISLLETNISLLATVQNPHTAGIRVNNLRDSFARLWHLRTPGHKPYDNYPDVFDMSIFLQ